MKKRTFLKLATTAAACVAAPSLVTTGRAQSETYGGPYWVFVTAAGGWDPRFTFDPALVAEQNRLYSDIGQIGNIRYAPIAIDQEALGLGTDEDLSPYLLSNEQFLTRFGARLTVFNGVDTSTNNHDAGMRSALSGQNPEGYPALGALIAATRGPNVPVTFMSSGGYDFTGGHVPLARVTDVGALRNLARPNVIDPNNEESDTYHAADTYSRIRAFQRERLEALVARQRLPRFQLAMNGLQNARATDNLLASLQIPAELVDLPGNLGDLERFEQQAQIAVGGFASGLAVSANLQLGGFDTHGNHDRDQVRQIVKLWGGLAYLLDLLDTSGLGQNTYVVVASDFGRGPHYNGENTNAGKDHWPITSTLVLGPGVPGDRVIGATNDAQLAQRIDPATLAPGSGVKLTPGAIHQALRGLSGISSELVERYPLSDEPLPLFS